MTTAKARYDGHADWYDDFFGWRAAENFSELTELLGRGDGYCLDLGCGTGLYLNAIAATGRTVVGLDRSADQLRIARGRLPLRGQRPVPQKNASTMGSGLVQGDGAALPFADATFETVAAIWISTDVDDFGAVLAEAVRVLRPGGLLVFYGAHPCFNGPHSELLDDGAVVVHASYRNAGWHEWSPWWNVGRVRDRVGMRHHPLAELLGAFIETGLRIERLAEFGRSPVPNNLSVVARK
jgi:SAM-dependent methyltransferase